MSCCVSSIMPCAPLINYDETNSTFLYIVRVLRCVSPSPYPNTSFLTNLRKTDKHRMWYSFYRKPRFWLTYIVNTNKTSRNELHIPTVNQTATFRYKNFLKILYIRSKPLIKYLSFLRKPRRQNYHSTEIFSTDQSESSFISH